MIYGPVNNNGIRRTRYNSELYMIEDELDIVKVRKIGRQRWLGHFFRWLGHFFRMHELDPC